jgi:hypothetical protein
MEHKDVLAAVSYKTGAALLKVKNLCDAGKIHDNPEMERGLIREITSCNAYLSGYYSALKKMLPDRELAAIVSQVEAETGTEAGGWSKDIVPDLLKLSISLTGDHPGQIKRN